MGLLGVDTSLAPKITEEFEYLILHQINGVSYNGDYAEFQPQSLGFDSLCPSQIKCLLYIVDIL